MSILPGSLDYLYYNGILDHIPYEAYESMPVVNSNYINTYSNSQFNLGTQYLDTAKKGNLYQNYNNIDTFNRNINYSNNQDYYNSTEKHTETNNFKNYILNSAQDARKTVSNTNFLKGLATGAIMIGTLFCLLSGKKANPSSTSSGSGINFWKKLNPFKK